MILLTVTSVSADENLSDNATNIQVPEKIWKDGDYNITIETDKESCINITGALTYNTSVAPGKTSIPIKNLTTGRHNVYINNQEYNISVLKENPNWDMDFTFLSEEILYGPPWDHELIDSQFIILNRPEGLTGTFTLYENGVPSQWSAEDIDESMYFGEYYEQKIYNFTLIYSGDDYFQPAVKTKITEFVPVKISIPNEFVSGSDDNILIALDYDPADGKLSIKIDNETVLKKNIADIGYYYEYSLNKLKTGEHIIEVNFTSDYYNKIKRVTVNVTDRINDYVTFMGQYYYSSDYFKYTYGDKSNQFHILSPEISPDILIDGEKVSATYKNNYYIVNVGNLTPGTHRITVNYAGDKKYAKNTFEKDFEVVVKANTYQKYFTMVLPEDASGKMSVDLKRGDDYTYYKTVEVNGSAVKIDLPSNYAGSYRFRCYFTGNYEVNEIAGRYTQEDIWNLNRYYPTLNDKSVLEINLPEDAIGNLIVEVLKDKTSYMNLTSEVINGSGSIKLPTNHIGEYSFKASFEGNYEVMNYQDKYTVEPEYYIDIIDEYTDVFYNSTESVSLNLPENATGTLTLEIKYSENENYTFYGSAKLVNGKASIRFPTGHAGKIYYNVLYVGNYELYNTTDNELVILPYYEYKNNVYTIIADEEFNATFTIEDWTTGYEISADVIKGKATIDLRSYLNQINETAFLYSYVTTSDGESHDLFSEEIYPDVKIVSSTVTMYYGDSKVFQAKIFRNGKVVGKGEKISVKIGSEKYTLKTDKNGIIKMKLTQVPGKYTVKVTYKSIVKTGKLTVKQILTLKKVNVKKSAKKLVLTATLKNKKAIKGKIVKFKFNGKTYKAKTDRKGIAKVTIKKSVLNKLKVGKKLTYTATYLKDTVKRTVKVKK